MPVVNQRGHRLALTLDRRDRTSGTLAGKRHRLTLGIEIGGHGLGPVEDRERRIAEHGPQPRFQLLGRPEAAEFDDRFARRRLETLRAQLAGHEADRHDAVLLGGFQQPRSSPIPRRFVFEAGLIEPRKRVADMRQVVDRQAPSATGIDVSEGAVRQLGTCLAAELGHALIIAMIAPVTSRSRRRRNSVEAGRQQQEASSSAVTRGGGV